MSVGRGTLTGGLHQLTYRSFSIDYEMDWLWNRMTMKLDTTKFPNEIVGDYEMGTMNWATMNIATKKWASSNRIKSPDQRSSWIKSPDQKSIFSGSKVPSDQKSVFLKTHKNGLNCCKISLYGTFIEVKFFVFLSFSKVPEFYEKFWVFFKKWPWVSAFSAGKKPLKAK